MVASGQLDTYLFTDIFKGKFVAVFAQDPEENFGLPFWIGKVHDIRPPVEENDSDSEETSEEDVEGRVTIHEYIQKEKTQGEGSTSCTSSTTSMDRNREAHEKQLRKRS